MARYLSTFLLLTAIVISGCSGIKKEAKYPTGADRAITGDDNIYGKPASVFGKDGLSLFNSKKKNNTDSSGITVNAHLWRASLDTVSFMPLASADPFGGVILTDWYVPEASPDERLKLNVFILSKDLRSDGVRVRVFKQVRKGNSWVDAEAAPQTARDLEDAILTRARQLHVASLSD